MVKKVILLAFVALGIALAVPSSRAKLQDGVLKPVYDGIRGVLLPDRLEAIADQIDWHRGRYGGFPDNWENWLREVYTGSPEDPWGNLFFLNSGRRDYTVGSMGGDGVKGTEDDITLERPTSGR